MAETVNPTKSPDNMPYVTVALNEGGKVSLTVSQAENYIHDHGRDMIGEDMIEVTPVGPGGLTRLDFHIEKIKMAMDLFGENAIPISLDCNKDTISGAIPYFAFFDGEQDTDARETMLMACDLDAITTQDSNLWEALKVEITNKNGVVTRLDRRLTDAGLDPENIFAFRRTGTTKLLTLGNVMTGLLLLQTTNRLVAQALEEESNALTMLYTPIMAQHNRASTRRKKTLRKVSLKNSDGEIDMVISGIEGALELNPSSRKTFALLNSEATKLLKTGKYRIDGETVCRVILSVDKVAELYGITVRSARNRLNRDFNAIANESISAKDKKDNWATFPVAGDAFGRRGDSAFFTFSPSIMKIMFKMTAQQVDLPPELYGTDDTNFPAAFQIGTKLYAHDNQNLGKSNRDRMKLTTLLKTATEIPKIEDLQKSRLSPNERIMKPFEANMNHLVEIGALAAWDYCHEKGAPLTDEEQQVILTERELGKAAPWKLAKTLLVTWEIGRRYPMLEAARQASRDNRRQKALEATALKEKEEKASRRRIRSKRETMIAKSELENNNKSI